MSVEYHAAAPSAYELREAVTFTAACPACGLDAEWTSTPYGPEASPRYSIACPVCP